jgi:hypothetical protein
MVVVLRPLLPLPVNEVQEGAVLVLVHLLVLRDPLLHHQEFALPDHLVLALSFKCRFAHK